MSFQVGAYTLEIVDHGGFTFVNVSRDGVSLRDVFEDGSAYIHNRTPIPLWLRYIAQGIAGLYNPSLRASLLPIMIQDAQATAQKFETC